MPQTLGSRLPNQNGRLQVQNVRLQLGRRMGIKQGPEMTFPRKTSAMASEELRETAVLAQSCQPARRLKNECHAR
jgi:hypothetical protein